MVSTGEFVDREYKKKLKKKKRKKNEWRNIVTLKKRGNENLNLFT